MKIIVFGVGNYYKERRKELSECLKGEIVAFTDNRVSMWGSDIDNAKIIPPNAIKYQEYDIIVIMSIYWKEIQKQLVSLYIEEKKIKTWEQFRSEQVRGKIDIFPGLSENKRGKDVLIISTDLDYTGAPLTAVYAAMAAKIKGYNVVLAARSGDAKFIQEIVKNGITVAIIPVFPYIYDEEMRWIRQFSVVLVNTFPMIRCAVSISRICPTLWWLHEVSLYYKQQFIDYTDEAFEGINIYAVSNIAKDNFNRVYSNHVEKILQYGIPDMAEDVLPYDEKETKKTVFAVIGKICKRKAQDIYLEAIEKMNKHQDVVFWIIGDDDETEFSRNVIKRGNSISAVKFMGVKTRAEMYDLFPQIDVVICTSREETMSITITEGMMFGKVCITTDRTGMAAYIENGVNGFVVPAENVEALKEKMEWVVANKDNYIVIGKKARKTYEMFFSMNKFGDVLETAINETKCIWADKK